MHTHTHTHAYTHARVHTHEHRGAGCSTEPGHASCLSGAEARPANLDNLLDHSRAPREQRRRHGLRVPVPPHTHLHMSRTCTCIERIGERTWPPWRRARRGCSGAFSLACGQGSCPRWCAGSYKGGTRTSPGGSTQRDPCVRQRARARESVCVCVWQLCVWRLCVCAP
jgi:hypothetical protein